MSKNPEKSKIKDLTTEERTSLAKDRTKRVVDHLRYLIALNANNEIINYSPLLASQIPSSRAANAFNIVQESLHRYELVRLCALWDGAELPRENILTVTELVDSEDVIEALALEEEGFWVNDRLVEPIASAEIVFGRSQGDKVRVGLKNAIADARRVAALDTMRALQNLRHKNLAHLLAFTREERHGPVQSAKYGDEKDILRSTIDIVRLLHLYVNHADFPFDQSERIAKTNAEALWGACKFSIKT